MATVLLIMVFAPLAGAFLILGGSGSGRSALRAVALVTTVVTFVLAACVVAAYRPGLIDPETSGAVLFQMETHWKWLAVPDVQFAIGVDGISLWLVGLTALLMVTAVLVSWDEITDRPAEYYALLLALETGLLGVFCALDIILFYIFFEFTLIPLFFLIGIWGHRERRWAARKFFIYTLAGSVLTFLALVFLVIANVDPTIGSGTWTFSIPVLLKSLKLPTQMQYWVFLGLFAGFAIKVPLFPFHTWLPLAHVEAPTAGSVILAGVLLKVGTYGFLRFSLALLPDASVQFMPLVAVLSIIGILYGAFVALAQQDMKRLVAYSSVSHLGFCMLGLFALNPVGLSGGLLQMINHGLSTGALFALVGMLYERYHTRDIELVGGLARRMPGMAFFLVLAALSSIGLPGLNGFVGEVMVLLGIFRESRGYAVLATAGIVLGAWYMLWLVERTFFGQLREPPTEGTHGPARDIKLREIAALAPIAVFIVWIGVYPQFFLRRMEPSLRPVAMALAAAKEAQQRAADLVTTEPAPEANDRTAASLLPQTLGSPPR